MDYSNIKEFNKNRRYINGSFCYIGNVIYRCNKPRGSEVKGEFNSSYWDAFGLMPQTIKTINNQSLIGSGNITIAGGSGGNSYFPSGW